MYKQKKSFWTQVTSYGYTKNSQRRDCVILYETRMEILIRLGNPSRLSPQGEGIWSYPNAVIYLTYANIRQNSMVY